MGPIAVISVFLLTSVGVYLLLGRTLFRAVLGLGLITHAANLLVMMTGGWHRVAPLVQDGATVENVADPLPQALLLTAIVISMAVTIYLLALMAVASVREGLLLTQPAPATDEGRSREEVLDELEGRSSSAVTAPAEEAK
ncbi:MAG: NADH-quinone oxidoreductase subunit K [Chrysiogenetes bacterium]|nr:NADH-quinone oxidoreductase subunit K [Chrysiogenetes bacterium]